MTDISFDPQRPSQGLGVAEPRDIRPKKNDELDEAIVMRASQDFAKSIGTEFSVEESTAFLDTFRRLERLIRKEAPVGNQG